MSRNALKQKWAAGEATINGRLSIGCAFSAEIMAEQGYDSLTVDIPRGFLVIRPRRMVPIRLGSSDHQAIDLAV